MRWDYAKPEKKLMVSDGATLWVYEPEDEQAYKQDLKGNALPAQVSFLLGEGKLDKEFDASLTKVDGHRRRRAGAEDGAEGGHAAYRYIVFVVDAKSGQVKQTIIYGQDGSTNRLSFVDVQQNKGVDDGKFKFSPPSGTHILKPPRGTSAPTMRRRRRRPWPRRRRSGAGSSAPRDRRARTAPRAAAPATTACAPTARSVCDRPYTKSDEPTHASAIDTGTSAAVGGARDAVVAAAARAVSAEVAARIARR